MPISYTYNSIFIHIPKCAGTTIEKMLGTCTVDELFSHTVVDGEQKNLQHLTYLELKSKLKIDWSNYYVFSVVRNPYDRFVSEYKYLKELFFKTKDSKYNVGEFSDFVKQLKIPSSQRILKFDGHLETQFSFLKNEDGAIDSSIQIFNFENLDPCWEVLKEKTGVEYSNYLRSKKSVSSSPYHNFYTEETKSAVYDFYKKDFDAFGYDSEYHSFP